MTYLSKKTTEEIQEMKEIAAVISYILNGIMPKIVVPGLSSIEIQNEVEKVYKEHAITSINGFIIDGIKVHESVHVSVGREIVHGKPSKEKKIKEEDIVKIDLVGFRNGLYADAARTYIMGKNEQASYVYNAAREAIEVVMDTVRVGDYMSKISKAIEGVAKKYKLFVVPELTGHSIGGTLHQYPPIPNVYIPTFFEKNNFIIPDNLTLAIEPVFLSGNTKIEEKNNIISCCDDVISVHYEDTILFAKRGNVAITNTVL